MVALDRATIQPKCQDVASGLATESARDQNVAAQNMMVGDQNMPPSKAFSV